MVLPNAFLFLVIAELKEAGRELSYTSQIKENIRKLDSIDYARMLYHVTSKICYNSSDVMKSFHKWNERSDINSIITVADEAYTVFLLQNYETHYKQRWKWTKMHKVRFGESDFKKKATKEEQRAAMPLWNFQPSSKSQSGISPVRNGGFTIEGMQQYMLHHTTIRAKREEEGAKFNAAFGTHLWRISKEIWPDDEDEWFGFDASKPVGEQYVQKRKRRLKVSYGPASIRYKVDINDMPC